MTCIVGVEYEGGVLLGADSCGGNNYVVTRRIDPKVFKLKSSLAVAFTTSFRMGQLLHYKLQVQLPGPTADLDRWMATTFVDRVRDVLDTGGFRKRENDQESGGTFLVAVRDRLYWVGDDFQVARSVDGYSAAGSGEEMALGALHATARTRDPKKRATAALAAATHFSPSVLEPFHFERTK
jgi:ATP-dependent protease HslVU (ClpYQ) peptidase subunit